MLCGLQLQLCCSCTCGSCCSLAAPLLLQLLLATATATAAAALAATGAVADGARPPVGSGNRCQHQSGRTCPWQPAPAEPAWSQICGRPNRRVLEIWVIRHGQAYHNIDPVDGWRLPDPGLTPEGFEQAISAARAIPDDLELVVTSPLRRCIQTGRPAIAAQRQRGGTATGDPSARSMPSQEVLAHAITTRDC